MFFKRYLFACLQEVTSSLRLFKVASSGLQMMKYFSHRHKLQRFETGRKGGVCFKIFQVIPNFNFASFKCQTCLLSSVLSLLLGSLKEDLWLANLVLNEVSVSPHKFGLACCLPLLLLPGKSQMISGNFRPLDSQLVFGSCMLSKLVVRSFSVGLICCDHRFSA